MQQSPELSPAAHRVNGRATQHESTSREIARMSSDHEPRKSTRLHNMHRRFCTDFGSAVLRRFRAGSPAQVRRGGRASGRRTGSPGDGREVGIRPVRGERSRAARRRARALRMANPMIASPNPILAGRSSAQASRKIANCFARGRRVGDPVEFGDVVVVELDVVPFRLGRLLGDVDRGSISHRGMLQGAHAQMSQASWRQAQSSVETRRRSRTARFDIASDQRGTSRSCSVQSPRLSEACTSPALATSKGDFPRTRLAALSAPKPAAVALERACFQALVVNGDSSTARPSWAPRSRLRSQVPLYACQWWLF